MQALLGSLLSSARSGVWRRCVLLLAAAGCAAAQQGCSINSTVTLRNFNKAGAGANGNPDFGFLPEPADVSDKRIVKATLSAAAKPVYSPATGFNTTTTHSKPIDTANLRSQLSVGTMLWTAASVSEA